jgi:hypothetical protein
MVGPNALKIKKPRDGRKKVGLKSMGEHGWLLVSVPSGAKSRNELGPSGLK